LFTVLTGFQLKTRRIKEDFGLIVVLLSVGPLLPFEDITSILVSPGQVTGPSQGESIGGAATLMPLDLHAFL